MSKARKYCVEFFIFLIIHVLQIKSLSYKIGNPLNANLQTGESTLFSTQLALSGYSYFTITLPSAMSTDILEGGVGIAGTNFIIEHQQGFVLYVNQLNSTQLTVQAQSNYPATTYSSGIYELKIRYIVSNHPFVDIDYATVNFLSNFIHLYSYGQCSKSFCCRYKLHLYKMSNKYSEYQLQCSQSYFAKYKRGSFFNWIQYV